MSKKFKISILFLLSIFALLYTIIWFYVADNLCDYVQELIHKTDSQTLSVKQVEATGFPFQLKIALKDLHYTQNITNQVTDSIVNFTAETFVVETNLLFNKLILRFPTKSSFSLVNGEKKLNFDIASKDHFLSIKEDKFINTYAIVSSLINRSNDLELKISEVKYHNDDFKIIDLDMQKEFMTGHADTDINVIYRADGLNIFTLRADNNFKINENSSINTTATEMDLSLAIKPRDETFALDFVDIRKIECSINDLIMSLYGKIDSTKDRQLNVDMQLKLLNAKQLITQLANSNQLSHDKLAILDSLFAAINGEAMTDNMEMKIYTSQDATLRIGRVELSDISDYIQQFIMSK